jgi:glycerophosphoryl diester phosphodiesterase
VDSASTGEATSKEALAFSRLLRCFYFVARPLFIAHRGASAEAPENTLAAFRRAIALGVDGIELDVQVSRDGVPMVFHDATLVRLTGARGRIAQFTRCELQEYRVRGEAIPTLAEVLALTRDRCVVEVELKLGTPVAPVVESIRRARAGNAVILASFERKLVAGARLLAPQLPRMLICEGGGRSQSTVRAQVDRLAAVLAALGASGVSLHHEKIPSAEFIAALKCRGFCVWCWTVNQPRAMLRLARWGADAILSDDPALLRSTLPRSASEQKTNLPAGPATERRRRPAQAPRS